jgi:hypothetical protein
LRFLALLFMLFPPDLPSLLMFMLFPPDLLSLLMFMLFPPLPPLFPDTVAVPLPLPLPLPLPFPSGACKVVTLGGAMTPFPHRVPKALAAAASLDLSILSELFKANWALILPPCPNFNELEDP